MGNETNSMLPVNSRPNYFINKQFMRENFDSTKLLAFCILSSW